jgi:hypothetical protein
MSFRQNRLRRQAERAARAAAEQAAQEQAAREQVRAGLNNMLDSVEKLFAATDLTRVAGTELKSSGIMLAELAQAIGSSDAAGGWSGRAWHDTSADRITALRAQLDAALAQGAERTRQWVQANAPDAIAGNDLYATAGFGPGGSGRDAAIQYVRDNVPEAGKIRDVIYHGMDDNGVPIYQVIYEIPDADTGEERVRQAVPREVRRAVWQRDDGRCRHCGVTDAEAMARDGEHLHYDHIRPWSQNGADTVANLQLLCGPCNREKGASYRVTGTGLEAVK